MTWTIEAKVLPLLGGVTGHLYLEIFKEDGTRFCQVNGLATDRLTGQPKAMGFPGDSLKAYIHKDGYLWPTEGTTRDNHPHQGLVLFSGSKEEVLQAFGAIQSACDDINAQKISYIAIGTNSNTVYATLVDVIAKQVDIDQRAVGAMRLCKRFLPGIYHRIPVKDDFNAAAGGKKKHPPRKPKPPKPGQA